MPLTHPPKAFLFDIFGTVVNWRHSLALGLHASAQRVLASPCPAHPHAATLTYSHFAALADDWYAAYLAHAASRRPHDPYVAPPTLWGGLLRDLLPRWGLQGFWTDAQLDDLVRLWWTFDAWPDSAAGLARIGAVGATAALSDGTVELLASLRTHNNLPLPLLFGSDTWRAYKPARAVYLGGVEKVGAGLAAGEVALVAAHLPDLRGAARAGLRTVYVERPGEERASAAEVAEAREEGWVDLWVGVGEGGLVGVAERLEALGK